VSEAAKWLAERGFKRDPERDLHIRYSTLVEMVESFESHLLRQVRDAMLEITNGHTIMVGGREWLMHAMFEEGGRFEIAEEEA
jgi:hypothetical protein